MSKPVESELISFRLSTKMRDEIAEAARNLNMPVSEFIRYCLFRQLEKTYSGDDAS